jgi:N-acetylglucosaminyldiphosphoundecaprenol N-acetyl-beta-D-mannosaminyltransferase
MARRARGGVAGAGGGVMKQDVLGVALDAVTMRALVERVDDAIARRARLRIGVVNAAKLVRMRRDPELRHDVLSSDVVVADGVPLVWTSRLLGRRLPERVAGIDLMAEILRRGAERGYRVYCLGATDHVLGLAVDRIRADHPGVRVVGRHHGYFRLDEEPAIAAAIASAKPDVLLVAMSSPRKERFLARWGDALGVPVCHGVGGSFDVLAGKVRRAPVSWQRLGLEWLYRVAQEPRRLGPRYLVTNSVFCALVLSALLRRWIPRPSLAAGHHR